MNEWYYLDIRSLTLWGTRSSGKMPYIVCGHVCILICRDSFSALQNLFLHHFCRLCYGHVRTYIFSTSRRAMLAGEVDSAWWFCWLHELLILCDNMLWHALLTSWEWITFLHMSFFFHLLRYCRTETHKTSPVLNALRVARITTTSAYFDLQYSVNHPYNNW